jgi:hypothetical protein
MKGGKEDDCEKMRSCGNGEKEGRRRISVKR